VWLWFKVRYARTRGSNDADLWSATLAGLVETITGHRLCAGQVWLKIAAAVK
jgi:hypothetical protein